MEKVTKREMYEAIADFVTNGGECKYPADVVATFCKHEVELLDKKAAKSKEAAAKKRAEGDEITDLVRGVLSTEDFETIADITAKIGREDITVSKTTYRLTQLVKNGEAEKSEVTIPATEGSKARKVAAYRAIASVEVEG